MERLSSHEVALEQKRLNVAAWISGSLLPVEHLLIENKASQEQLATVNSFEVRDYQLDSWASVWEARENGAKSALVHLATGLGKTSVGVFDVIKYREQYTGPKDSGPRILFASHQKEINEQAAERFNAFIPDASQGSFMGHKKELDKDITFATLQSLQRSIGAIPRDYFDYIIYDEAHHSKADTFEKVVKYFKPQFQLALTATPNRMDQLDIRELFGNVVYSKGLAEALAEGLLADIDYHIVFDDAVKEAMETGFEANSLRALTELFNVEARNEVIAKNIKEEIERIGLQDPKTIVFCQSIEHADKMAILLGGEPYHSKLETNQNRADTLTEFRNGNLQIICTKDMFNEGIDIPDARLIVFLRSTSSQTIFEQQLGRGLRKQIGKDKVSVLDFVANIDRILLVQELMNNTRDHSLNKAPSSGNSEPGVFDSGGDDAGNLLINTNHGEFDFDKLSIDLLTKYNEIISIPFAPDGWMSINQFTNYSGATRPLIENVMKEQNIVPSLHKFGNKSAPSLDPDQINALLAHPSLAKEQLPEVYYTATEAAEYLNITNITLNKLLIQLGWHTEEFKNRSRKSRVIDNEQITILKKIVDEKGKNPGVEVQSIPAVAKVLDISPPLLRSIIDDIGLNLELYRFNGTSARGITPDDIEIIKQHPLTKIERAPEHIMSVHSVAKQFETTDNTILAIISENGIDTDTYKFGSVTSLGINKTDLELIASHQDIAKKAPEGWYTRAGAMKALHISAKVLERIIEEEGIILSDKYKFGPRRREALSPEQFEVISQRRK